jgi:hypothetical protein
MGRRKLCYLHIKPTSMSQKRKDMEKRERM